MKNQLTTLALLATLGWSATSLANEIPSSQLEPVNTALISIEISVEQPELNIKSSIIDQVNENLQQHLISNGILLIARESSLLPNQDDTTRTE